MTFPFLLENVVAVSVIITCDDDDDDMKFQVLSVVIITVCE
jgi:hypothetical protein